MLLYLEAAALLALAVILAGPVSVCLSRASWPARAPRAGLVLWQAVGLGGGLGILTAGLTLAAADLGRGWILGIATIPTRWQHLGPIGLAGLTITVLVGIYLISATIGSGVRLVRARAVHRQRLDLVSSAMTAAIARSPGAASVRLLDHPHAVAYGVPGFRPRVVLTRGALDALSEGELLAVLAHEDAHVSGHHDLVVQPFVAWARTFPFLAPARGAVDSVSLLVEMLADDAAIAQCGTPPLRTALGKLADQHLDVSVAGERQMRTQVSARLARLSADAPAKLSRPWTVTIYALATALVLLPPLILVVS